MNSSTIKDIGYFILRFGLGLLIAIHGWPKITGGVPGWEKIGGTMSIFGINFMPGIWGLLAAVSEFLGGICVVLGIFFRPACALILITMAVAIASQLNSHKGIYGYIEAAEMGVAFLAMLLMGPGRFSLSVSLKK